MVAFLTLRIVKLTAMESRYKLTIHVKKSQVVDRRINLLILRLLPGGQAVSCRSHMQQSWRAVLKGDLSDRIVHQGSMARAKEEGKWPIRCAREAPRK